LANLIVWLGKQDRRDFPGVWPILYFQFYLISTTISPVQTSTHHTWSLCFSPVPGELWHFRQAHGTTSWVSKVSACVWQCCVLLQSSALCICGSGDNGCTLPHPGSRLFLRSKASSLGKWQLPAVRLVVPNPGWQTPAVPPQEEHLASLGPLPSSGNQRIGPSSLQGYLKLCPFGGAAEVLGTDDYSGRWAPSEF
jgi:hypothetical protein